MEIKNLFLKYKSKFPRNYSDAVVLAMFLEELASQLIFINKKTFISLLRLLAKEDFQNIFEKTKIIKIDDIYKRYLSSLNKRTKTRIGTLIRLSRSHANSHPICNTGIIMHKHNSYYTITFKKRREDNQVYWRKDTRINRR